ncbi:MFS transporter [Rhodococcus sp. IEGM 1318]|uniref:MFS transporter n=1 Tax=Rhodococcus sp. IEGM 1318 TaxID=3082226 RepID=UPI002953ADF7|nr:MFS transporter [Rhodococcus sp. IEGM 1318]MDV8009500.1 MFS transporter [Rhodococcus sp. IEGM 1318]
MSEKTTTSSIPKGQSESETTLDRVYRKIAWRILPFVMFLWVLAWMDRANISFAKLEMQVDLGFSAAVYGLGAGIFYIGYLIFEVPSNLYMQKIGARKTIARIVIGWGLVCALTSLVQTPWQFYAVRFLLGAFEAGFYPGIIVYLTLWFPAKRRAKIFGFFMSASALSGVIGGPLAAFLMTHFDGALGLSGWQWIFLGEGIPTAVAGVVVLFYLTDHPHQAKWLTAAEKNAVIADLQADANKHSERSESLREVLRDRRLWVFTGIYFCTIIGNATVAFWGPTIIKTLTSFSIGTIGWIISAISLFGAAGMVLNGYWSDRNGDPRRCTITSLLFGAAAFFVLAFVWTSVPAVAVVAFGCALVGAYSTLPTFWQIPNLMYTGTAAAGAIAIINSFGNLGGFVAPYALGLVETRTGSIFWGLLGVGMMMTVAALLVFTKIPNVRTGYAEELKA